MSNALVIFWLAAFAVIAVAVAFLRRLQRLRSSVGPAASADPPSVQADTPRPPIENKPATDFLLREYDALVSLYTHTENTLFSIFNFYLTLLSTITGGVIVLVQINGANLVLAFPTLAGLLVFTILLGIITQDALVNKTADLARYARAMNLLKEHLLGNERPLRRRVLYMFDTFSPASPMLTPPSGIDRWHRYLWWMLPIGMHQLFVSMVNSLALAVIAVLVVVGLEPALGPVWELVAGGLVVVVLAFIAHSVYVHQNYQRRLGKSLITLAGEAPEW